MDTETVDEVYEVCSVEQLPGHETQHVSALETDGRPAYLELDLVEYTIKQGDMVTVRCAPSGMPLAWRVNQSPWVHWQYPWLRKREWA